MSPLTLDRPARLAPGERCDADRGRRLTLEQRLGVALGAAQSGEPAECPVCRGPMGPVGSAARCGDCGSVLS